MFGLPDKVAGRKSTVRGAPTAASGDMGRSLSFAFLGFAALCLVVPFLQTLYPVFGTIVAPLEGAARCKPVAAAAASPRDQRRFRRGTQHVVRRSRRLSRPVRSRQKSDRLHAVPNLQESLDRLRWLAVRSLSRRLRSRRCPVGDFAKGLRDLGAPAG